MKTPNKYNKWLESIKLEIDYNITDEASFEIEKANYKLLYDVYKKMSKDVDYALDYATMYNQLLGKHMKFLENYGLNGNAKLKNQYLKNKVKCADSNAEEKDELDIFKSDIQIS